MGGRVVSCAAAGLIWGAVADRVALLVLRAVHGGVSGGNRRGVVDARGGYERGRQASSP